MDRTESWAAMIGVDRDHGEMMGTPKKDSPGMVVEAPILLVYLGQRRPARLGGRSYQQFDTLCAGVPPISLVASSGSLTRFGLLAAGALRQISRHSLPRFRVLRCVFDQWSGMLSVWQCRTETQWLPAVFLESLCLLNGKYLRFTGAALPRLIFLV